MSITPFHFACHCEERIRAQCDVLDAPLGSFMQILRRVSLTENRAVLQFGAKAAPGEEFAPHVTFSIQLVPQKDRQTAFNCSLDCPSEKLTRAFRLLLNAVEESETQLLKVFSFLQKAFAPLNYTTAKPVVVPEEVPVGAAVNSAMATAQALVKGAATQDPFSPEAAALTRGKKYIFENTPQEGVVQLRTHDGKYVPEGQLPAVFRVLK